MHEAIAKLWITRLRTADKEKCQEILGSPDGCRCVMGHLCDLAVEAGVIEPPVEGDSYRLLKPLEPHDEPSRIPCRAMLYQNRDKVLPYSVAEWAGVGHVNGYYSGDNSSLVGENDQTDLSLKDMADIIEERWRDM